MVEAAEILILDRVVLSVKTPSLLTDRDYVLVDEVSLYAQMITLRQTEVSSFLERSDGNTCVFFCKDV